jgi:acyl-coenzyme A synthetase/AMP-(fatty) acid ligase
MRFTFFKYSVQIFRRPPKDQVFFACTNLSWISGIFALLSPFLNSGQRIITKEKFSPKGFGRIVRTYKVTSTAVSVEHCSMLMKSSDFNPEDYEAMVHFLCGGERVPCNVREFLRSNLKPGCFGIVYGSTESAFIAQFDREIETSNAIDNVIGPLIGNSNCTIIDVKTKARLGPNEVGEIYAKTETMFKVISVAS